jgi:hypothetical protein
MLPYAVFEVTDLEGAKEEVEGINRTNEDWWVATARVHVVVSGRAV